MLFFKRHSIIFVLLFFLQPFGYASSGQNLKILIINPEDCTQKTVELQYPQDNLALIKARRKNKERLSAFLKDGSGFVTEIVADKENTKFFVTYSTKGSFIEQRNVPRRMVVNNLQTRNKCYGKRKVYGDTVICEQEIAGQSDKRDYKHKCIIVDIETESARQLLSGGCGYELYSCSPFGELVIIDETVIVNENDYRSNFYLYNFETEQMQPIQFPEYFEPCILECIDMRRKAFGVRGICRNEHDGKASLGLFDVECDGKVTDISQIIKSDRKNKYIKTSDSDEYVLHGEAEEWKYSSIRNKRGSYFCRYSLGKGEINKRQIEINNKKFGISVDMGNAFATKNRFGAFIQYEPVSYFELFFSSPVYAFVIYDGDWNVLKSIYFPKTWQDCQFDGNRFYVSFY